jgi:hypothetical protein
MILSVNEIWDGRQGSVDTKNVRNYTRTFRVITDSMVDGPFQVTDIPPPFPSIFSFYSDPAGGIDLGAFCTKITPRQTDEPFVWIVTCEFSSKVDNPEQAQAGDTDKDPLTRPSVVKWSMAKFQRVLDRDVNDDPIVNSAGERFDPPIEIDDSRPVLSITRNEPTIDPANIVAYQDAVNTDTFFGCDPGTAKIDSIEAESAFENGTFYWKVSYTIHFRREGWDVQPLDQGYHHLIAGVPTVNRDPQSGNPYPAPRLLDGSGNLLGTGADPVFLDFEAYKEMPFAPLALP